MNLNVQKNYWWESFWKLWTIRILMQRTKLTVFTARLLHEFYFLNCFLDRRFRTCSGWGKQVRKMSDFLKEHFLEILDCQNTDARSTNRQFNWKSRKIKIQMFSLEFSDSQREEQWFFSWVGCVEWASVQPLCFRLRSWWRKSNL